MFVAPNVSAIMNSVPAARRGVASAISSTLFSVGSLVSLGLIFAIFGARVPLATLQAIFAGLPPPAGSLDISIFVGAMHTAFLVLAAISFVGILPTSRTAGRRESVI